MRIVITGIGINCALGTTSQEVLQALLSERTGVLSTRRPIGSKKDLPVGEVPLTTPLDKPRAVTLGTYALRATLKDAHLLNRTNEIYFVNGTTVGGMDLSERYYLDWQRGENLQYRAMHPIGACTDMIATAVGTFAHTATISTACSAALNSIIYGVQLLRMGKTKYVVVGGVESLTNYHFNGFHSLRILSEDVCKPFDEQRTGLNLGEGAAYIVLETEESAKQRNVPIYGYIAGYGNACDAFHQTASSDNGQGAYLAMTQAIRTAGITPQDIDYVNTHGTATGNNDASERVALQRVFGQKTPYISSTKGFTGHTTSASGSIEVVMCLLAMKHHFIPTNLNTTQPLSGLNIPLHTISYNSHYVLCNAFGFGGNDSSLVLSTEPPHNDWETIIPCELQEGISLTSAEGLTIPFNRRLTPQMSTIVVMVQQVLQQAHITTPDAIITATQWGCMHYTHECLENLCRNEEMKPSYFMQSVHNTIASLLAITFGCHGYNCTVSSEADMETMAHYGRITDPLQRLLLVSYDEPDPLFGSEQLLKVRLI